LLRLDELARFPSPSCFADSYPAEYEHLLIAPFKEPVCRTQHAVALDLVTVSLTLRCAEKRTVGTTR
jgi:hypothetical protein